jgi:hypothetical protein
VEVEKPPDISDAPTYADVLERAVNTSLSYRTRGSMRSTNKSEWLGCGCIFFVLLGGLIMARRTDETLVWLGFTCAVLIFFGLYHLPRQVRLRKARIQFYRLAVPYARMDVSNVIWIGTHRKARFIFGERGRRLAIPFSLNPGHSRKEHKFFAILFDLAKMKTGEKANNFVETGTAISIPLSEGATYRRLPDLAKGLLLLMPVSLLIIFFSIAGLVFGIKEENGFLLVASLAFLLVGLLTGLKFVRGIKYLVSSYGLFKEEFTSIGYNRRGEETPYEQLRLTLYRGTGKIDDPCPGVLEIRIPNRVPFFIGPERENFFALQYALKEWAGKSYRIRPIYSAPVGVGAIAYVDRLWDPPEKSMA